MIRHRQFFSWMRFLPCPHDSHAQDSRSLWRDERGASAIIIGLSLTAIISMVGLGVEVGSWYTNKRMLQSGADAAALGAAYKIYTSGNNSNLKAAAVADAARNGIIDGQDGVTVLTPNNPPLSGAFAGNTEAVEVYITQSPQLLFSILSLNSIILMVRSVARMLALGEGCVIALDKNAPIGINLQGSASLDLTGCGMFSNSASANSMVTAGGAQLQIQADYFAMVGGFVQSGQARPILRYGVGTPPAPYTGLSAIADPLAADVAAHPQAPLFTHADPNFGKNDSWAGKVGTNNNAVHFNAGLSFGANANIVIPSNVTEIYVTGELKINSTAVVNCACTFILMDANSKVTINGLAEVHITVPDAFLNPSARYPGIAVYNASPGPSNVSSSFAGTGNITINGALYFPTQHLDYRGDSAMNMSCTKIVASTITFIGNSQSRLESNPNCRKTRPGVDWKPKLAPTLVE